MAHRTYRIGGCLVNVFDSHAGAAKFIKDNAGKDYSVLLRAKTYFLRRGDLEVTINLKADGKHEHGSLITAAQTVAGEIETMILRENPKYAAAFKAMEAGAV